MFIDWETRQDRLFGSLFTLRIRGIPILRLGLNPTEDLSAGEAVGGAYHPALGELVYSRLYLDRARAAIRCSAQRVTPESFS